MDIMNRYFALREKRLAMNKLVAELEQEEKDLDYELQKYMLTQNVTVFQDEGYVATLKAKLVSNVRSWPDLLDHIRSSGQVDLLQKRVTESAVKARWDAGFVVPGIESVTKYNVTVTKELS